MRQLSAVRMPVRLHGLLDEAYRWSFKSDAYLPVAFF